MSNELVEHNKPERQSIITDKLRWSYVIGNGGASVIELAAGLVTGNVAQSVDGMHGTAEIAITNTQMKDAHETDHVSDNKRRAIYGFITAFSLSGMAVATGDLTHAWHFGSESLDIETVGLTATTISLGSCAVTASILVKRIRGKYEKFWQKWRQKTVEPTETDVVKHIVLKDTPSATLAFMSGAARVASGIVGSKHGQQWLGDAENIIGLAASVWGIYLFRPTRANLQHKRRGPSGETLSIPMEDLVDLKGTVIDTKS